MHFLIAFGSSYGNLGMREWHQLHDKSGEYTITQCDLLWRYHWIQTCESPCKHFCKVIPWKCLWLVVNKLNMSQGDETYSDVTKPIWLITPDEHQNHQWTILRRELVYHTRFSSYTKWTIVRSKNVEPLNLREGPIKHSISPAVYFIHLSRCSPASPSPPPDVIRGHPTRFRTSARAPRFACHQARECLWYQQEYDSVSTHLPTQLSSRPRTSLVPNLAPLGTHSPISVSKCSQIGPDTVKKNGSIHWGSGRIEGGTRWYLGEFILGNDQ
jgi:hypothetical protein